MASRRRSLTKCCGCTVSAKEHPDVIIGDGGFGTLQARLPTASGEIVTTRYTLRDLLDRLDELTAAHENEPGSYGAEASRGMLGQDFL